LRSEIWQSIGASDANSKGQKMKYPPDKRVATVNLLNCSTAQV
jgi:hypothetical protein